MEAVLKTVMSYYLTFTRSSVPPPQSCNASVDFSSGKSKAGDSNNLQDYSTDEHSQP